MRKTLPPAADGEAPRPCRRDLPALAAAAALAPAPAAAAERLRLVADARADLGPFRIEEHGFVGVYDADWLTDARYARMLDHLAASPGGFAGVRFFGALNAGTRERDFPTAGGATWTDPAREPDFAASLAALDALVSRGLVPFVALTFFPPAVSPDPIRPPADLSRWRALVAAWLRAGAARFGAAEVARWWLEAWNEPNMPQFWRGTWEDYLALYRATGEAARGTGLRPRIGGPALAWLPAPDVPGTMEGFLRFLAANPDLPCDFVSFHRKGIWDAATEAEPEVSRLVEAAEAVAEMALRIVPERCARGLAVVNNEADMRVGFQRPYRPRLTERFASWHAAVAVAHQALSARYAARGLRFLAAGDNANQHLVDEPFDGRRALLTRASRARPDDLIKLPVFHLFEMLRLCGPRVAALERDGGLHAMLTAGGVGGRLAAFAAQHADAPRAIRWEVGGLPPGARFDLHVFRVDGALSNSFAANGARFPSPDLPAAERRRVRLAAELGLAGPPRRLAASAEGRVALDLDLPPFATALALLSPHRAGPPAPPRRVAARRLPGGDVRVGWDAGDDALGFEVARGGRRVSPASPLLPRMWLDTAPPAGADHAVRAVAASGERSAWVPARPG